MNIKKIFGISLSLALALLFPSPAFAVVQTLNGQTGNTQTFANDSNITISSSGNTHSLGWSGILPFSRGGTGASSFSAGSILFSNGTSFAQDNSNLFWDNTNKRLGIGTNSPTSQLDVNGDASISGNLTVTGTITGNVNVTNLVPYTGATSNVNLGSFNLSSAQVISSGDSTINGLTVGLGGGQVSGNTVLGSSAMASNTTGNSNTAIGSSALNASTVKNDNTAVGESSLKFNAGEQNTAVGSQSMRNNTSGDGNSAFGFKALNFNNTGGANVAMGWFALRQNDSGGGNVAIGSGALENNTSGSNNVVVGSNSLLNSVSANNSIVLGQGVTGAGSNTAVVGNQDVTDAYFGSSTANSSIHAKRLYLGSSSVPGCIIMGDTTGGVSYITLSSGSLTVSSSPPTACQ